MQRYTKKNNVLNNKFLYTIIGLAVILTGGFSFIGINNQMKQIKENNINEQRKVEQKKEDVKKEVAQLTPPPPINEEKKENSLNSENQQNKVNTTASNSAKSFIMPIEGNIINKFSNGELVKNKTLNDWRTHNGIDIACKINDSVKAVSSGTIKDVYESPMWGTVVELELSDKTVCVYSNLNKNPNVKKGQKVNVGDLIGTVGKTAAAESTEQEHLHFEMMKDNKYIDPLSIIQKK